MQGRTCAICWKPGWSGDCAVRTIEREDLLADKGPGTNALLRGLPKLCPARFLSGNNPGAGFGERTRFLGAASLAADLPGPSLTATFNRALTCCRREISASSPAIMSVVCMHGVYFRLASATITHCGHSSA